MSLATLLEAARFLEQQERQPTPKPRSKSECIAEEEPPHTPIVLPRNGLRGPPPASAPIAVPPPSSLGGHIPAGISALPAIFADSGSDLPRARSNSNGSSGPRAGTREVHNKLEKNRRAHLKECFETLRLQLPSSTDDKKSSNLSILDSAIKHIQLLKRREKDLEHEMERLAREKIAHQQKLSTLRRDFPSQTRIRNPTNHDRESAMEVDEPIPSRLSPLFLSSSMSNAPVPMSHSGLEISVTTQSPILNRLSPLTVQSNMSTSLDLTTKSSRPLTQVVNLHLNSSPSTFTTRLIQNTSPPQSTSMGQRLQSAQIISSLPHNIPNGLLTNSKSLNLTVNPNIQRGPKISNNSSNLPTLTVTTVNPGSVMAVNQGHISKHDQTQSIDGKMLTSVMSSTVNGQRTIVHPANLRLPIPQVVNGGSGLVTVSPAIQLFSTTPQSLRVLPSGTLASLEIPNTVVNNNSQKMRDIPKVAESVGVNLHGVNGVIRTSGDRPTHHIAIKPQPARSINTTIRPTNSQGSITHMVNGLTPLVVSQGGTHLMSTSSHLTGKVMSNQVMKTGVGQQLPLAVSTQYLSAATIVNPVVVVSTSNGVPPSSSS